MGDIVAPAIEFIGSLGGDAAAPAAEAGAGGLESLVGSGAGLAGGATGLEGTALAGGADLASLVGAGGGSALDTAHAFLDAPLASGLADATGAVASGGIESGLLGPTGAAEGGANLAANAATGGNLATDIGSLVAGPSTGAGTTAVTAGQPNSVFNTGSNPITGTGASGQPAAVSAGSVAAPSGVAPTTGVDPTAAAGGASSTAAGGAPATPATPSSPISSLLGSAENSLTKNPLGVGLGVAGLGYNILQGQKQTANQKALQGDAATATANSTTLADKGAALQQYLTNGTLPPNYQSIVDQAINDAKTTAISNAAAQGLPTDPTKNTALAATLAKIDASKAGMQTQVAEQLFSSGASLVNAGQAAAGLSGQLYQTLVNNDTNAAANTGKAIATLAAALNGKSSNSVGGLTISQG